MITRSVSLNVQPPLFEGLEPVKVNFTVALNVLLETVKFAEFNSNLAPKVAKFTKGELPVLFSFPLFTSRVSPDVPVTDSVPVDVSVKPPKSNVPRLNVRFVMVRTVSSVG